MENAKLILRTNDATQKLTNMTNLIWDNLNVRFLLGDMYDKYDTFLLRIDAISQGLQAAGLFGDTQEDVCCNINIAGLPFKNATYNYASGNNTNCSQITQYKFGAQNLSQIQYFTDTYIIFTKSQETASLNIFYTRQKDNKTPNMATNTNPYPSMTFNFTIFGIPNKDIETLKPATRIDKNTGKIK